MLPPRSYLSGRSFRPACETYFLSALRGGGAIKINETVIGSDPQGSKTTEYSLKEGLGPLSSGFRPTEEPFMDIIPDPHTVHRMNRTSLITMLRKHGNFNCQRLKKSDLIQQVIQIQTSSLSLSRLQSTYGSSGSQLASETKEMSSMDRISCSGDLAAQKDDAVGNVVDRGEQTIVPNRSEKMLTRQGQVFLTPSKLSSTTAGISFSAPTLYILVRTRCVVEESAARDVALGIAARRGRDGCSWKGSCGRPSRSRRPCRQAPRNPSCSKQGAA